MLNIYIRMHACITHQLKKSKPFCASLVVQSAAMQTRSELRVVHELGDRVHHWQTGRCGTVTGVHENGDQIYIMFDQYNAAGMEDGCTELRRRKAFRAGNAPYLEVTQ